MTDELRSRSVPIARPSSTSSSVRYALTRSLAWTRAYLAAGDPEAAAVFLREALRGGSSVLDRDFARAEVLRLAEDLATSYLGRGATDEAAGIMRMATTWARGDLALRSTAERQHDRDPEPKVIGHEPSLGLPLDSQRTVVARKPRPSATIESQHTAVFRSARPPSGERLDDADDIDAVTAVFRSPLLPPHPRSVPTLA